MSLQDRLDAFKADFEGNKAPPAAVAVMHRATATLAASGQAQRALRVGAQAPAFSLSDTDGQVVTLAGLLAQGSLVITFYRGVWCPYCNLELQALEAAAADVRALGAQLVALSPQTPGNNRKSRQDNHLSFPVLSDARGEIAAAFGLRFRLPDELLALYTSFGVNLAQSNADHSGTLAMPARYIVATDGRIAYAEVNADYTRRPDPSDLLPVLRALQAAPRN